ncbi:MAG: FimB/Mfa2 family fimbrial subunit [Coprobacter sp.]|nr:FimB/Mfa2 family fimbrial subunit [Coprobacter sp.]
MKRCNIVFTATLLGALFMLLPACNDQADGTLADGNVTISLNTSLPQDLSQRAIGGTSSADGGVANVDFAEYDMRYIIKIYDEDGITEATTLQPVIVDDDTAPTFPDVTLTAGRTYKFVAWADFVAEGTTTDLHYHTASFPAITATAHTPGDESCDAYYAVSTQTVSHGTGRVELHLVRPLAKLRIVTTDLATANNSPASVSVAYTGTFATGIDLLTGNLTGNRVNPVCTATIAADDTYTTETQASPVAERTLFVDYLFAPASGSVAVPSLTLTVYSDAAATKAIGDPVILTDRITLRRNALTTIQGALLTTKTADVWTGDMSAAPTIVGNTYYVNNAADLAWLQTNTLASNVTTISIETSLDMASLPLSSLTIPAGITVEGNGHTISNLAMKAEACGLFGDVTDFTLRDLTVERATIANTNCQQGVGVLIGRSTGNLTLSGVSINGSSALAPCKVGTLVGAVCATKGAASAVSITDCTIDGSTAETSFLSKVSGECGGLVGYIGRDTYDDRTSSLSVAISGCKLTATTVKSYMQAVEKPFARLVGTLSGYDYREELKVASCDVSGVTLSPKTDQSGDLAASYASPYGDLLGGEAYCRATVTLDGKSIVLPWDGSRKVKPITATTATSSLDEGVTTGTLIYSPFDLAYLQGGSHSTVTFLRDVDMASKNFKPINAIATLDGQYHTLNNLSIEVTAWIGGFINQADGTTTHKNLTFKDAFVRVSPDTGSETAYAGTLCAYINGGNYLVSNIKAESGYLKGISKIGGIVGFITAGCSSATIDNCSVNKYTIENEYLKLESETFPASGEVGGLIGFISAKSATSVVEVKNSSVTNTQFNCCTYSAVFWDRSVAQFIGDIRTQNGETIKIVDCSVSGNSYYDVEKKTSGTFDKASWKVQTGTSWWGGPTYTTYYTDLVGQWYHLNGNYIIIKFEDVKGSIYITNGSNTTKVY